MSKEVLVYSTMVCPYCVRAKMLLKNKGVEFKEIIVKDDATRQEMVEKSGGRMTVPQIFIGEKHIGGFDDLHALDVVGKLDDLL